MSPARTVLLALPYDGDRAEVVREGGRTLLVGSQRYGGGTVLEGAAHQRLAREGVDGGRLVVGGLLPDGATRATVIDPGGDPVAATCGGGVWLVVIGAGDRWEPAVRFDDDAGRPVRPGLPEDWTREPVSDATEPCPACGATAWERVTPADFSRGSRRQGEGPEEPSSIIVCTRCGHEEPEGSWYGMPANAEPPDPAVIERHRARRRREQADVLARIDFTLYALVDGPEPELCGWGGGMRRIDRATVCHRRERSEIIRVESARLGSVGFEDPVERARDEFLGHGPSFDGPLPDLSRPALSLWLRARERAHLAALALAEPFEVDVPVDGTSTRVAAFRDNDGWVIAANLDGARVTATSTGWPLGRLALRSLEAPATEIRPSV